MNIELGIPPAFLLLWGTLHIFIMGVFAPFLEESNYTKYGVLCRFLFGVFIINAVFEFLTYMYGLEICQLVGSDTSPALYKTILYVCCTSGFLISSATITIVLLISILSLIRCILRTRKAV